MPRPIIEYAKPVPERGVTQLMYVSGADEIIGTGDDVTVVANRKLDTATVVKVGIAAAIAWWIFG